MKISTFLTMLLAVGIVMFVVTQMLSEAETNYDIEVNDSEWSGQYDFASDVNEELAPIKSSIDTIQNQESGWLDLIGAGFTGIIAAVTFLPSLVWNAISMAVTMITGLGVAIGIPPYITLVFIIMLTAWGIFKLVEFYQRWNV